MPSGVLNEVREMLEAVESEQTSLRLLGVEASDSRGQRSETRRNAHELKAKLHSALSALSVDSDASARIEQALARIDHASRLIRDGRAGEIIAPVLGGGVAGEDEKGRSSQGDPGKSGHGASEKGDGPAPDAAADVADVAFDAIRDFQDGSLRNVEYVICDLILKVAPTCGITFAVINNESGLQDLYIFDANRGCSPLYTPPCPTLTPHTSSITPPSHVSKRESRDCRCSLVVHTRLFCPYKVLECASRRSPFQRAPRLLLGCGESCRAFSGRWGGVR